MVSVEGFRKLALSFPGAVELPHFDRSSFRINNKIFATLVVEKAIACIMLTIADQDVFCTHNKSIIYPVPNKWGLKGATYFELKKVRKSMVKDALQLAYSRHIKKSSN